MAGLLARRAASRLPPSRYDTIIRREIHLIPIVLKKKAKVEIEDLFSDGDLIQPDLVSSSSASQKNEQTSNVDTSSVPASNTRKIVRKLTPEKRAERFDEVLQFVSPRIGEKPSVKTPLVRKSAWLQLFQLATTEAQMEQVAENFPKWHESRHQFDDMISEQFVRRCEELHCPLLALKVYGNWAKYRLPLPLPAARQLLHSLHLNHPLNNVMTAAALYDVYKLPAVTTDLISCSLLLSACYKHNSKQSLKLAEKLVVDLEDVIKRTEPRPLSDDHSVGRRPWVWVKGALDRIDRVLSEKEGKRVDWLSVWRAQSGYIPTPGKA